jgi:hypothetical protein
MVVPHRIVAPLTLLRYLFRLGLEVGKEMISKWKWLRRSKNTGEAPVRLYPCVRSAFNLLVLPPRSSQVTWWSLPGVDWRVPAQES